MATLPRTGFPQIDEAPRLSARTVLGFRPFSLPLPYDDIDRNKLWGCGCEHEISFKEIDDAYRVDSFVRQGVDKYVELITKHGHILDGESALPVEYLERRFLYMSIMTGKPFRNLVVELATDYIKYGNAFLLKYRGAAPGQPDLPKAGAAGQPLPVLGYYRVDPKRVKPVLSKDGKRHVGWEYSPGTNQKVKRYPLGELIHFAYNAPAGKLWGASHLVPVLEDIREYRRCEDMVIKLLFKHLHPLYHHEVPDNTNGMGGRQEDVDAMYAAHSLMAPEGLLITPPGHKIKVVGAESQAIRGEGYLQLLRERVYCGLGVSPLTMGEGGQVSVGSADAMTIVMHNKAKAFQAQLAELLTHQILYELLMEGGFFPLDPQDGVRWVFNEIETEALLKRENHVIQLVTNNLLSMSEGRQRLGYKPFTAEQYEDTHVFKVKIPAIQASADARASFFDRDPSAPDGPGRQTDSRGRPANQRGTRPGPKVRPR